MESSAFEEIKLFLQQAGPNGVSLFDHLASVMEHLESVPPEERDAAFEEISKELKLSNFVQKQSEETGLDERPAPNVLDRINLNELYNAKKLLQSQQKPAKRTPQPPVQFSNILEEAYYFKRFGVGLTEEELTVIFLHMKQYFSKLPMKSVRFFGKIIGLENNYYIAETVPAEPLPPLNDPIVAKSTLTPEQLKELLTKKPNQPAPQSTQAQPAPTSETDDPDAPVIPPPKPEPQPPLIPIEEPKEGNPNEFVYWVCTSPLEEWQRLPDVTPAMIRQSRLLSKMFTGCLDAPVSSGYPSFDGTERHLLRALIARISHSASVIPRAMLTRKLPGSGEEEEEEEDDGTPALTGVPKANAVVDTATLNEPRAWMHARAPILVQGRAEKWPPKRQPAEGEEAEEGGEDEEEEVPEEAEEDEDAENQWKRWKNRPEIWEGTDEPGFGRDLRRKRAIDADKKMADAQTPSFTIRTDGMLDSAPVVLVKSLYWPGFYTLAYGGKKARLASIYIGFGRKYNSLPSTLPPPPVLPEEHDDMPELIDPTVDEENQAQSGKEEAQPPNRGGEEEEEEEEEEDY